MQFYHQERDELISGEHATSTPQTRYSKVTSQHVAHNVVNDIIRKEL